MGLLFPKAGRYCGQTEADLREGGIQLILLIGLPTQKQYETVTIKIVTFLVGKPCIAYKPLFATVASMVAVHCGFFFEFPVLVCTLMPPRTVQMCFLLNVPNISKHIETLKFLNYEALKVLLGPVFTLQRTDIYPLPIH